MADLFYRRANLEHAAASLPNMMQAGMLLLLLSMIVMGPFLPNVVVFGVHPLTVLMFCAYGYCLRLVSHSRAAPMWHPAWTN